MGEEGTSGALREADLTALLDEAQRRVRTLVVAYIDPEGDLRCCWSGKLGDINWLLDRTKHTLMRRAHELDNDPSAEGDCAAE